jgi:hypothetical protein
MLEDLLALHPLERSWLDEIVDVAVGQSEGQVMVGDLVQAMAPSGGRTAIERTVRLCLEDFSSGVDGAGRPDWDLFCRMGPQRHRLRSHPVRPEILEFVEIRFREPAVKSAFETFADMIESQQPALWAAADNRRRLDAFARVLAYSSPAATAFTRAPDATAPTDPRTSRKTGWRRPAGTVRHSGAAMQKLAHS